jgi:tetratricopeptide (TPR) repeat protein
MKRRKTVTTSLATLVASIGLAFFMGGAVMWLIMRPSAAPPAPPAASLAQAPAPPDVAGLPAKEAAVKLANWNYDQGNWAAAIQQYEQAIGLGVDNADIRTDLGNCYRFSSEPRKALEQYQIAQRLNPMHENSLFNTAGLYGEILHDHAKAAETWRLYLTRFPEGAGAARARQFLAESTSHEQELKQLFNESAPKQP